MQDPSQGQFVSLWRAEESWSFAMILLKNGTRKITPLYVKGSNICTLPGTILIQILYLFFHVFCVYSILLSTDFKYSHVPGDPGGPIFFRRKKLFLAVVLCTNWYTTICITCPNLRKIECNAFVCNEFVLVLLLIDIIICNYMVPGNADIVDPFWQHDGNELTCGSSVVMQEWGWLWNF